MANKHSFYSRDRVRITAGNFKGHEAVVIVWHGWVGGEGYTVQVCDAPFNSVTLQFPDEMELIERPSD